MRDSVTSYLEVKGIKANWKVAARLPFDLACQWHALPIAEEHGHITVAMANPEDKQARDIITSELGVPVFTVQANLDSIDELIAEIWTKRADQGLKMSLWKLSHPDSEILDTYAHRVSNLLGGELEQLLLSGISYNAYHEAIEELARDKTDLVICEKPTQKFLDRLFSGSTDDMLLKDCPATILFAGDHRLPIGNILLVIQGVGCDVPATNWAIRFAEHTSAHLVVLPVTVPIPVMYGEMQHERHKSNSLLNSGCPTSLGIRKIMHQFMDLGIQGTLKLRNESPELQIWWEFLEGDYDLVIIGAESQAWERKIFASEIVYPTYLKISAPLLVAKPGYCEP